MGNNGYISIDLNGEKIGLKFGMPAIRQFGDKLKKGTLLTNGSYNELGIAHIIYAGYCCNCEIKYEDPSIKFETFYLYAEEAINDEARMRVIKDVIKCFEDSQYVKQIVENVNKGLEQSKKKTGHGTRSKPSVTESLPSPLSSISE